MHISTEVEALPERYRSVFARIVIRDVTAFSELLELVRSQQRNHPDVAVFVTLDDLDQALYTSMHATESDELEVDTDDLDFDDPRADAVLQHRQFAHTSAQLANPELRLTWADLSGTRAGSVDEIDALVEMNENPVGVLDDVLLLLHVPVDDGSAAIAAMPNGYFSEDWNVLQNHAATRHLAERYGYRPLGIGASWIGFQRDAQLLPEEAAGLVGELADLYGTPDAPAWQRLGAVLTGQTALLLGYAGNFAD